MIELRGVTKSFGKLVAVDDLTLEIGPGEVYGFIGPNGAGKSTTMKILACLLRPDTGVAKVGGHDVTADGDAIRRMLGYMPDVLGVYDDLTVEEYLHFFAAAFSLPRKQRRATIDGVLELTDLTAKKKSMVDSLSRGMKQRLGVARVLVHDPKVLLLDEPTGALDVRTAREMLAALLAWARNYGATLVCVTHRPEDLEVLGGEALILLKGKVAAHCAASDILDGKVNADVGAFLGSPGGEP